MHEAGHTLGLTHNFRASTAYSEAQLDDSSFTKEHGIAASVMDYNPVNLGLRGKPHGAPTMERPGPYDAWAIEYAYRVFAREDDATALSKLAARSGEPGLAFSNDRDAGEDDLAGVDPEVNRRDLGSDPLAFARRRFALSRELWGGIGDREYGRKRPLGRISSDLRFGALCESDQVSPKPGQNSPGCFQPKQIPLRSLHQVLSGKGDRDTRGISLCRPRPSD